MSGGIRLQPLVCWLKAGWLAEYVATEMRSNCGGEVASRFNEIGKWAGAIADFCSASSEEIDELYEAVLTLSKKMEAAGPSIFHDPAFFPRALNAVEELVALLRTDPRRSAAQQGAAADARNARG